MTDCRSCDQGWHNKSYWVYLLFHIVGFHCFFHDHLKSVFCIFLAYPWLMLFLNDLQKVSVTCKNGKHHPISTFWIAVMHQSALCSVLHLESLTMKRFLKKLRAWFVGFTDDGAASLLCEHINPQMTVTHHSQLELTVHHSVHSIFCFSFWHYCTLNIEVKWHSWESGSKQNGDLILTC